MSERKLASDSRPDPVIEKICRTDLSDHIHYILPWDSDIFFERNDKKYSLIVCENCGKYGMIRHFENFGADGFVSGSFNAYHIYKTDENEITVQTAFLKTGSYSDGIYREKFEDKFFLRKEMIR